MLLPPRLSVAPTAEEIKGAENWARRLNDNRSAKLEIAERRLVSAVAQRLDRADALIDAVIIRESLVGTRNDTVFRVTAALAKLLERDPAARVAMRKKLSDVYNTRSRVIHGDLVDHASVSKASAEAIDISIRAIGALHDRSGEWLTMDSSRRADQLILGD